MSPWWRGAVIYQIYPRSFRDANGDGIGDLAGITEKLDYVRSLGVDAIWISPFFLSPMKDFGYDVADYRAVDPIFGTNEDFDRLLAAAHDRGLKVVIDMVMAHTSDQHPWFAESRSSRDNPKADWYVWADPKQDGSPPNNWISTFGGSTWQWDTRRSQYYLHHFLKEQPNLNWHNDEAVAAMLDEARYWLAKGVDGLRLDAISTLVHDAELRDNPPAPPDLGRVAVATERGSNFSMQLHIHDRDRPEIMHKFAVLKDLMDAFPDAFTLGEIGEGGAIEAAAKYTNTERGLDTGYTFELTKPDFGWERLHEVVGHVERVIGRGWKTYAFSNHDVVRAVTRWGALPHLAGDGPALAKLLLALITSLRGSACIYQGEELGLTEAELAFEDIVDPPGIEFWPAYKGRDGCRTPFPWAHDRENAGFGRAKPWLPVPAEHVPMAADLQERDPASVLNAFRTHLRWRKLHPALIHGSLELMEEPDPVVGFVRATAEERILCLFNLSNEPARAALPPGSRPLDGHGFSADMDGDEVALPPFGVFYAGLDK